MFPRKNYDFDYKLPSMANGIASFDDLKHISPFFTETNAVSYAILLEANRNKMTQDEIEKMQNLICHLTAKENETMKAVSQYLKTREEYNSVIDIDKIENDLDNHIAQQSSSSESSSSLS